ncbi:P-loop containing nucleoside triphosphate hydrolase protein [Macrolepiota fuliginosa MF-IS2]|uniref:P-loop containing nucleoside triphosphate hydrolase protein n=1 Tax=Macrolepiota fuliginosa MF-IS2 TaxID=1400762 RepID=A0A9P6C2G0_9AGAR|nr:P-loop containing nucleoside triphosphate hydrolase protein [Macrolepiota fuliginosa MF-IS2]
MPKYRKKRSMRKGSFDTEDRTRVQHSRIGVWDLYEEITPRLGFVGWPTLQPLFDIVENIPYVWRMTVDVFSIRECNLLLLSYLVIELVASLLPALSLWYSGQLLHIVQTAVEHRAVDKSLLFQVATGRFLCSLVTRILRYTKQRLAVPLNVRIKQHYSVHMFHAMARLDLPTFDDPKIQQQLESSFPPNSRSSIAWDTITMLFHLMTTMIQLVSQLSVLIRVLGGQRDGPLLAFLSFSEALFQRSAIREPFFHRGVWAATTRDSDYIRNEGLKRAVHDPEHRKEITAGGMWPYLLQQYRFGVEHLKDRAGDFWVAAATNRTKARLGIVSLLQDPFKELPQIVFTLRAIQYPASIPISLASLNLITQTTQSFTFTLWSLFSETDSFADKLLTVRRLYEVTAIQNQITDGVEPYPEDSTSLRLGMSIEFRDVSFRYPGCDEWALRQVSFKIEKGQLCVIVGANGSGKSTILKLIARLYDPAEGEILLDGRNIRRLRLDDLRRATSVLFQDYTHFPLSLADNIGLGAPTSPHATNMEYVQEAARLGGASTFVEKLPEQYQTYLERPVKDYYSGLPEGMTSIFGRVVDYGAVKHAVEENAGKPGRAVSGGQEQRIALSRTFMRSVVADRENDSAGIGLLLFDEPSASLDPTAEHELFERLRHLRGNKTMVFSSHRFGNLTRHADIILFMSDSAIIEEGTHDALLEKKGEYARIWMLQAQAFL